MSKGGRIAGMSLLLSLVTTLAIAEEKLDQLRIAVGARGGL